MAEKKENPYVRKTDDGRITVTAAGEALLSKIVTDTKGPVYAFTNESSPLLAAAAMARLSRRGSDLREIYLDEFAATGDEGAEGLIDRVVTGYGDDSVQQLITVAAVVEDASNLLTKKIEKRRLAAYLEQSTRYIYYDQKNTAGEYKYFTPRNLPEQIRATYRDSLDRIFTLYSEIVRGTTEYVQKKNPAPTEKSELVAWRGATRAQACDAARPTLPAATKSTVGIVCSSQSLETMVRYLLADPLEESNETGRLLLRETRKVIGAFLKRADLPERGLAWILYLRETKTKLQELVKKFLPTESGDHAKMVRLINCSMKDELDLVPGILFESGSELSEEEIRKEVSAWPPEQKEEVLAAYIGDRLNRRHKPGRALEELHYKWEIVADYGTFRDLQRHRIVDDWEWQNLTAKYGYDVPELITEAGFEPQFRECFAISEQLWKTMADAGFAEEAQYATLFGHKLRYHFIINAREAFHLLELRTSPQGHPGYRKICQEMHRQLSAVHPRLGAAMKFVNQGGDPPLTRLEAERATQLKLKLLDEKEEIAAHG
ncbi:MAG: FAD-dependent thymidylate synthase [Patescibacteria group bacterium]|nr:FAD-dependent thymidylate synthase [Patescibacteria group bacterium]